MKKEQEFGITNMNGVTDDEGITCGINDMNCLAGQQEKESDLNNMNSTSEDAGVTCSLNDMNCRGGK